MHDETLAVIERLGRSADTSEFAKRLRQGDGLAHGAGVSPSPR